MIMRMFALKDVKMQLFMQPMFLNSRAQVIRLVQDEVNRPIQGSDGASTTLQSHPEDVVLYEIGEFDNESGVLTGLKEPVVVVECKDLANGRS